MVFTKIRIFFSLNNKDLEPGEVTCVLNHSTGEADIGGSLEFKASQG